MSFRVPTMPLTVNIWRNANFAIPPVNPPDVVASCQLRMLKTAFEVAGAFVQNVSEMLLLVPKGTDIRDANNGLAGDGVEVPAGSGRFYGVWGVDDVAKGFTNEYRAAAIFSQKVNPPGWPVPFP